MEELSTKPELEFDSNNHNYILQTEPNFSPKQNSKKDFNHLLSGFDELKFNFKKTSANKNTFELRNNNFKSNSFMNGETNKLKREINLLT